MDLRRKKNFTLIRAGIFAVLVAAALAYFLAKGQAAPVFLSVIAPPYTKITAKGATLEGRAKEGVYRLMLPRGFQWPLEVRAVGPMGGTILRRLTASLAPDSLIFKDGRISDRNPDPENIEFLPTLCPRLKIVDNENGLKFIYDAKTDRLNHIPMMQLIGPNVKPRMHKTLLDIDGKNTLQVRRVKVSYDYEDASIIEYEGPDNLTGKACTLKEGYGGFYANINYAVVPYSGTIADLDRQTLLHLAQGSLEKISREDLNPELRTQAFFPGPFHSTDKYFYHLCEWGDTRYHASVQEMEYENMALWDWDYPVKSKDRVMLIVWEGDEEHLYPNASSLPANYLIDDLIAVFDIARKDTVQPLTLRNDSGDFEITVQSGDMEINR